MKLRTITSNLLLFLSVDIFLFTSAIAQSALPDVFRLELKRVDETWRILDRYAGQAWPGWTINTEIPFRIDYPDGVCLYIGKPTPMGNRQTFDSTRMKLVDTTLLRGKKIYLDESRKNSIRLTSRLAPGGGGAGLGRGIPDMHIRRVLVTEEDERTTDSLWRAAGSPSWPKEMSCSTDQQIVILMHEYFHCYANFGAAFSPKDTLFSADLNYAIFSEIEGELIENAANEPDTARMKDLLRQFLVARSKKRQGMSPKQRTFESDQEKAEGTATYAADRIVQLLKKGYEPLLSSKEDPQYFGFHYYDYFTATNLELFHKVRKNTLQVAGKAYGTGYLICKALDRLLPDWKKNFFTSTISMDQLIAQASEFAGQDTAGMVERLKKEYHYAELAERHSKVIGSRDSVIKLFSDPQLKSFAINYGQVSMMPMPRITSTGAVYSNRIQIYFAAGTGSIRLGDMSCECSGIPMCEDIHLQSVILPDVEAQTDAFHYVLTYSSQEPNEIYRDATVTGKHFTLRAPRMKIVKTPSQVQFTILPMKQASLERK